MSQIKPAIWQSTTNKMIAYRVHLSFFDIGLGFTPEAAWMDLDKQIKPITIAAMIRFMCSPFLLESGQFRRMRQQRSMRDNICQICRGQLRASLLLRMCIRPFCFFLFIFHNANYIKHLFCCKL